jgi:hypothetical protein
MHGFLCRGTTALCLHIIICAVDFSTGSLAICSSNDSRVKIGTFGEGATNDISPPEHFSNAASGVAL